MPPRDRTRRRVLPTQERSRASIEAILGAAERLLREEGFARMTTNRIGERAGVNVALVYRYFAGKEAIVGALIERTAAATLAALEAAMTEHRSAPLPAALRALFDALIDTPNLPDVHRELVEHVDVTKRRELVQQLRDSTSLLFAGFLEERRAELRTLPDPEAMRFVLGHAIEAATNTAAFYRPKTLTRERTLDALTELVLRALVEIRDPPARPPGKATRARSRAPRRTR